MSAALSFEPDDVRQASHAHDHLPNVFSQHAAFDDLDAREQHRLLLFSQLANGD